MMNFLDLSAASEEERRLITELLSDTSVVNFAEPSRQPNPPQQNQEQQHKSPRNEQQANRLHHLQHSSQHVNHQLSQKIKPHQQQHQHQHLQNNYTATSNALSNHVHNQSVPRSQDIQYLPHQVPFQAGSISKISNNAIPSTQYNSHLSAHNNATTSPNTTNNSIDSNNVGAHLNNRNVNIYAINDNGTNNSKIKAHNYQNISQDDITVSTSPSMAKTTATIQTSPANDATFTTCNVTQSTSTVPPQTIANQMPPLMAGDINPVIGMEMASSQPPGYPMPTPQPPHVTAYGPAPPHPHHVYGGPPIFQPYTAHYLIPYNLPYPMSYVLPPTNSVVPTRQQVAPQPNQQASTMIPNNSHTRPHVHHPRFNKMKEMPKQQHHNHHNHHMQHQHHQLVHHQSGYRSNANLEPLIEPMNDVSGQQIDSYENSISKSGKQPDMQREESTIEEQKSTCDIEQQLPQPQLKEQQAHTQEQRGDVLEDGATRAVEEADNIKVSSDEGFDTQSSLDLSKQSHESSHTNSGTAAKLDKEISNQTETRKLDNALTEPNNDEKSQLSQEVKNAGPWGSAASKSWASLFRGDGFSQNGPSTNGEIENDNLMMTDTDNSEGDGKRDSKVLSKPEANGKMSIKVASTKEQRSQDAARRAQDKMAPKLAHKINSISLKHSLPLLRPRGFINKGNGCYINSTLQALIACPPFYNLMKEIGDLRGLKRDCSCTPILDSFAELFQNFPPLDTNKKSKQVVTPEQKLSINYLQAEAIEPRCIYNVLGQIKSECLRGAQEDAEEFLSSVLNGLHEEMIGLSETLQSSQGNSSYQNGHLSDNEDIIGDINNDENLWREVGSKNRSLPIRAATVINTPIQEIFGGSLFSIRTAGKDRCGHRSPFFDLQLDISGDNVKSLQDAIKSFTATEIIQDFYCSKTKQKLDAQRRTSLDQLPPILILHLKQFIYTQDHGLKKLMKRIEYPIDFELPESCLHDKNSDKNLKNSRSYKLLAVVYHEGKEAVKGHYLTDVYHIGSSQWIRCDDGNLKVVSAPGIENLESSRTPYLLFYRRLNTLGFRQSNSHDNKKKY